MYKIISVSEFVDDFRKMGRLSGGANGGNFTYEGAHALFEMLEELGDDVAENPDIGLEFDVIGLCCQFAEFNSASDAMKERHPDEYSDIIAEYGEDDDDVEYESMHQLTDMTMVHSFDNGIIIDQEY